MTVDADADADAVTTTSASDSPVFSEMVSTGGDIVSVDGIITDI